MELELMIFKLISHSGEARSFFHEAIGHAKQGQFESAEASLKKAETSLVDAHSLQTGLIQKEAAGEKTEMSLLMVHAQDHIMTTMLFKEMAAELVEVYKRVIA